MHLRCCEWNNVLGITEILSADFYLQKIIGTSFFYKIYPFELGNFTHQ